MPARRNENSLLVRHSRRLAVCACLAARGPHRRPPPALPSCRARREAADARGLPRRPSRQGPAALGVAGGRCAAQVEVRPRPREPNGAHRALEPSIGPDRLREPVERWAPAAPFPRGVGRRRSVPERERVEHDARALDAVGLGVGLGNPRRGGRHVGAARQIAALDLAHQPALDVVGGIVRPVAEMKILRVVGVARTVSPRRRRDGRQGGRIVGDVEIGRRLRARRGAGAA